MRASIKRFFGKVKPPKQPPRPQASHKQKGTPHQLNQEHTEELRSKKSENAAQTFLEEQRTRFLHENLKEYFIQIAQPQKGTNDLSYQELEETLQFINTVETYEIEKLLRMFDNALKNPILSKLLLEIPIDPKLVKRIETLKEKFYPIPCPDDSSSSQPKHPPDSSSSTHKEKDPKEALREDLERFKIAVQSFERPAPINRKKTLRPS
jgi:hypothetical protein